MYLKYMECFKLNVPCSFLQQIHHKFQIIYKKKVVIILTAAF